MINVLCTALLVDQFSDDSHVLSQVNKAPARSLDACLGEGVVA